MVSRRVHAGSPRSLCLRFIALITRLKRQENITALLDLLDKHDFFSRLYALQLISAISAARPERTQECVYTAPLGVSRLVAILDDKREAVRTGREYLDPTQDKIKN